MTENENNPHGVKPGQIWADNDKRSKGRHIKVMAIETLHKRAVVRPCTSDGRLNGVRITRISLRRFTPTTTGYRLVEDVTE
jgi:hypothetical protein